MNGFLDDVLVGLILLAGFGYAAYALGPKSLRARLLTLLGAKSRPGSGGAYAAPQAGDGAPDASAPAEIRVPLAKIGKRR